jgi:pimeloyl-ACP methyl ester carboxylesterase
MTKRGNNLKILVLRPSNCQNNGLNLTNGFKFALKVCMLLLLLPPFIVKAQTSITFNGEKSTWHEGFDRYDFIMDDSTQQITPFKAPDGEHFGIKDPPAGKHRCVLIAPKQAAAGNPWSWRGCYWDHQPQAEVELLRRGFYIAYISASATLRPGKEWDAWYKFLTEHGLSAKPAFIGMSRGGEFEFTWATGHPDKVTCIYADNPAVPIDILMKIGGLAKNDVPLLHVCGSIDPLFNIATGPVENIYQQFGGRISVMIKEGFGHHPHSLHDPKPIADFIEQSFKEVKPAAPAFAGPRGTATWFYSNNNKYEYFPGEGAYITYRGPLFAPAYRRYLVQIPGVDAFTTIIAPQKPAPGNPWIFRADYVKRDDTVSLALLHKGYYIVTGAVPYNYDGPVLAQWNNIYNYLVGFGFSKKTVMCGNGGAAGEAIAWAIENPDKVCCIYATNPILKSKVMTKIAPLDNMLPLANAGIPVLLVCGSNDPSLKDQALVVQKKYKQFGGKITVIIKKDEGHYLLPNDAETALGFIASQSK